MKTTALAEDSAVSRMVRLVEEAQNQHSRTEQLVEKVAKYYTPRKLPGLLTFFHPVASLFDENQDNILLIRLKYKRFFFCSLVENNNQINICTLNSWIF